MLWVPLILGAGALVFAYGALVERNWFVLRRHVVPCLPAGSEPIRILHMSDLHLRSGQRRKRAFLAACRRLAPDVAVGTGDFLGDGTSAEAVVEALGAIAPRFGGMFVLGSNDYYLPRAVNPFKYFMPARRREHHGGRPNIAWRDAVIGLEATGWRFLNNAAVTVDGIEVVGLDDPHIGRADLSAARPRTGEGFRLGVVHSPDAAPALADLGYDLILCGHTHGGQVRVPGIGALVTNSDLPRRMARGLHRLGGAWLHVSAGLGTSMFAPFRFACRPEVCLLECVPLDSSPST